MKRIATYDRHRPGAFKRMRGRALKAQDPIALIKRYTKRTHGKDQAEEQADPEAAEEVFPPAGEAESEGSDDAPEDDARLLT